jgi:hypothetical protein
MGARGRADTGPYKAWDPVTVIVSSKLIVLVERMQPRAEANVAITPGSPIGTIMELRVIQVLDGEKEKGGTILLFQPASSDRGWQYFDARKFVLFLRPVAKEQRAELVKLPKGEYPRIQKKFSEIDPADVIWTPSSPQEQWMSYYPIEDGPGRPSRSLLRTQLSAFGVGHLYDPLEYLIKLVRVRRLTERERGAYSEDPNPPVREVATEVGKVAKE